MSDERRLEHDWFPRPLPENVDAGPRSWIYSAFAFVHCRARGMPAVRIGADTGIYNGTFFDLGPDAEVVIDGFCTLVGAIIQTNGRVSIGRYSFIAHEVMLADNAFAVPPGAGDSGRSRRTSSSAPRRSSAATEIRLGENCWIGMGAVLLAGTALADGCVVGAGAVVDFAAPPYSILAGNPARIVGTAV